MKRKKNGGNENKGKAKIDVVGMVLSDIVCKGGARRAELEAMNLLTQ
jgi:hypothetical protein